jgi:hypothetical protein
MSSRAHPISYNPKHLSTPPNEEQFCGAPYFLGHGLRKKIRGPLINLFNIRPDYQLLCFTVQIMHDLGRALKPYMPLESTCKQYSFSKRVIPLGL